MDASRAAVADASTGTPLHTGPPPSGLASRTHVTPSPMLTPQQASAEATRPVADLQVTRRGRQGLAPHAAREASLRDALHQVAHAASTARSELLLAATRAAAHGLAGREGVDAAAALGTVRALRSALDACTDALVRIPRATALMSLLRALDVYDTGDAGRRGVGDGAAGQEFLPLLDYAPAAGVTNAAVMMTEQDILRGTDESMVMRTFESALFRVTLRFEPGDVCASSMSVEVYDDDHDDDDDGSGGGGELHDNVAVCDSSADTGAAAAVGTVWRGTSRGLLRRLAETARRVVLGVRSRGVSSAVTPARGLTFGGGGEDASGRRETSRRIGCVGLAAGAASAATRALVGSSSRLEPVGTRELARGLRTCAAAGAAVVLHAHTRCRPGDDNLLPLQHVLADAVARVVA